MEAELAAVAARLRAVEDRLERLLAAGWRNAAAEAVELTEEAEALAALGLGELAGRLRAVAAAGDAPAALGAIALAVSACRLLRAHLPAQVAPPGAWAPLAAQGRRGEPSRDRLLPLARLALGNGEVWACAQLNPAGGMWVLIEPLELAAGAERPAPEQRARRGLIGSLLGRAKGALPAAGTPMSSQAGPWLRRQVRGRLRWRASYPLGAQGEVRHGVLDEPEWLTAPDSVDELAAPFRAALAAGEVEDGLPLIASRGGLQIKKLDPSSSQTFVWPDPAAAAAFEQAASGQVWALVWAAGHLTAPLAVLRPGTGQQPAGLTHLVAGNPTDDLPA